MKDGGPAFPVLHHKEDYYDMIPHTYLSTAGGMSLRDWFASQVLGHAIGLFRINNPEEAAEFAYAHADAMLKAREEKP